MEGKKQFDEYLGGSEKLPSDVHVMKLVSSRASEIAAMTYSIENPQQTKLVFQKLPVYMRRRVMSHNTKRLPRKLREAHFNQMSKSGLPPKSKRPSRRYRRRPHNLLSEYNRRQRKKIWLETHIWHAKRFHMIEKWGYRLANYANDKCFKANYRAVAKHCLIQDISYYTCIEIIGPENVLKETLKAHCNPNELSFSARVYTAGNREGTLMFFKRNGYPKYPIGNVHFLWRPTQDQSKTIWIWVHPSFIDEFLEDIILSFDFKNKNEGAIENENLDQYFYTNNKDKDCSMNILKNKLNRFRLYGPLTCNTITNALQIPKLDAKFFCKPESPTSMDVELQDATSDKIEKTQGQHGNNEKSDTNNKNGVFDFSSSWHYKYYGISEHEEILKIQAQLWQMLKTLVSPSQLPPNIVLGFTVLDPRFYLPDKRTKVKRKMCNADIMPMPPTSANHSPIWDANIRQNVTSCYTSTSAINKLRNKCLVPGVNTDTHFSEEIMAKIPILLIQKPGFNNTGLCSGIDIIIPSGWAMPFWLAFLLRCTRVGALRESRSIAFECKNARSPDINDPDTSSYKREALSTKAELAEKYFRYPPNRRVNFTKLGISSPFFCQWDILIKEWTNADDYFVLRQHTLLSLLQTKLSEISDCYTKKKIYMQSLNIDTEKHFEHKNCLVRIKLSILKKGCPRRFALICMPTEDDLSKLKNNKNWSGPVEKLHSDPYEKTRKKLRKEHLVLLKRLKRQRIRHRKALIAKFYKTINQEPQNLYEQIGSQNLLQSNPKIITEHRRNMSNLYIPPCQQVRNSCDREVLGYVTVGDFSFSQAKGIAIGFITLTSLIELINKGCNFVLIRNTQTRQYRFANLEILN